MVYNNIIFILLHSLNNIVYIINTGGEQMRHGMHPTSLEPIRAKLSSSISFSHLILYSNAWYVWNIYPSPILEGGIKVIICYRIVVATKLYIGY